MMLWDNSKHNCMIGKDSTVVQSRKEGHCPDRSLYHNETLECESDYSCQYVGNPNVDSKANELDVCITADEAKQGLERLLTYCGLT